MTPEELSDAITHVLKDTIAAGQLTLIDGANLPQVRVERPKSREHGDWATNIALQLAKKVGKNPREVATVLADKIASIPGVSTVDIAGPGFLNITLDAAAAGTLAATIVEANLTVRAISSRGKPLTSSSFRLTPPAPSTWAAPAGRPWATRSPISSKPRAQMWCANTISTITALKLIGS